jgi:hypothetical protein
MQSRSREEPVETFTTLTTGRTADDWEKSSRGTRWLSYPISVHDLLGIQQTGLRSSLLEDYRR